MLYCFDTSKDKIVLLGVTARPKSESKPRSDRPNVYDSGGTVGRQREIIAVILINRIIGYLLSYLIFAVRIYPLLRNIIDSTPPKPHRL